MAGVLMGSDLYPAADFLPGAQKSVNELANGQAESGKAQTAPAFAWVGVVAVLVVVRVLWEISEKAQ